MGIFETFYYIIGFILGLMTIHSIFIRPEPHKANIHDWYYSWIIVWHIIALLSTNIWLWGLISVCLYICVIRLGKLITNRKALYYICLRIGYSISICIPVLNAFHFKLNLSSYIWNIIYSWLYL